MGSLAACSIGMHANDVRVLEEDEKSSASNNSGMGSQVWLNGQLRMRVLVRTGEFQTQACASTSATLTHAPYLNNNPVCMCVSREILTTVMRKHQCCFTVCDAAGHLLPCFVTVAIGPMDASLAPM